MLFRAYCKVLKNVFKSGKTQKYWSSLFPQDNGTALRLKIILSSVTDARMEMHYILKNEAMAKNGWWMNFPAKSIDIFLLHWEEFFGMSKSY